MEACKFLDQMDTVTNWFKELSKCEQTVVLCCLLKKITPFHARFLEQILRKGLTEQTERVELLETLANDEDYVRNVCSKSQEQVIHELLQLLPLLQVGKDSVKEVYLQNVHNLLQHTNSMEDVSRNNILQLLSYLFIHPAVTAEERHKFATLLPCLEKIFTPKSSLSNTSNTSADSCSHVRDDSHTLLRGSSLKPSQAQHLFLPTAPQEHCYLPSQHESVPGSLSSHNPLSINTSGRCPSMKQHHLYGSNVAISTSSPGSDNCPTSQYLSPTKTHLTLRRCYSNEATFGTSCKHTSPLHATSSPPSNLNSEQHFKCQTFDVDDSGYSQYLSPTNRHSTLRTSHSHEVTFKRPSSHTFLRATSSAPSNFNSELHCTSAIARDLKTHSPLERTSSKVLQTRCPKRDVTDWFYACHGQQNNMSQASHTPRLPHAPVSTKTSASSSSSGVCDCQVEDILQTDWDRLLVNCNEIKAGNSHNHGATFRSANSHTLLHATSSAPPHLNSDQHRIYISQPPESRSSERAVSDIFKTNQAEYCNRSHTIKTPWLLSQLDHTPVSIKTSASSTYSGVYDCYQIEDELQPARTSYMEDNNITRGFVHNHSSTFRAKSSHTPLHVTSSTSQNINSDQCCRSQIPVLTGCQKQHELLRRTLSILPETRLPKSDVSNSFSADQSQNYNLPQTSSTPQLLHVHHLPVTINMPSLSSSSIQTCDYHQIENKFDLDRDDVPIWLKSMKLHKYSYLFKQMNYEQMLGVTEEWLEQQVRIEYGRNNVTKGARRKLCNNILKLRERQNILKKLEKHIVNDGGSLTAALKEMDVMLTTPIKAFSPALPEFNINQLALHQTSVSSASNSSQAKEIMEGDLPGQFCQLMDKMCSHLQVTPQPDAKCLQSFLLLTDKCLQHNAFSSSQKNRMLQWKQSAKEILQPLVQKFSNKLHEPSPAKQTTSRTRSVPFNN